VSDIEYLKNKLLECEKEKEKLIVESQLKNNVKNKGTNMEEISFDIVSIINDLKNKNSELETKMVE
jgi:hypothetical protein